MPIAFTVSPDENVTTITVGYEFNGCSGSRTFSKLSGGGLTAAQHQQIGYFSANGDVQRAGTPAANNVNLLVNMVLLNYMALHGEQGAFTNLFATRMLDHGLGNAENLDRLTAFAPIV